jgi:hypothetical protein
LELTIQMKQFIENFVAAAVLVLTEAWFLKGYFAGQPDFEPAILFIAALGVLLTKDPIRTRLSGSSTREAHDQALFQEFLRVLPVEPTVRVLKEHHFGDALRKSAIDPLYEFNATWDGVEKEFLDRKLEAEKKALFVVARELANEIAGRTVPLRNAGYISVFSDQQRAEGRGRPPDVLEDARILNVKASAFASKYEAFVRLCRKRLAH